MDFDLDDVIDGVDSSNKTNDIDNNSVKVFSSLSENTIVPKVGVFLGLDISQNSSGICLYKNSKKFVYNSAVTYDIANPHAEALMRKQLKDDLLEVIDGEELDLVVIEDVFEGYNAEVVRKLYALNTAIDDLIIEGKVKCKEFRRVQNGTWKSWLSVVDTNGEYKGYNDKEKIQRYLEKLGIYDEGEGFQDRLDATGMLLGYFLKGFKVNTKENLKKKALNVSLKDMDFAFEEDSDLIVTYASELSEMEETNVIFINDTKISVKKILEYMSKDISAIFITKEPVRIGLLADKLGLDVIEEGGYFGFWLSDRAQKKYKKRLERLNIDG